MLDSESQQMAKIAMQTICSSLTYVFWNAISWQAFFQLSVQEGQWLLLLCLLIVYLAWALRPLWPAMFSTSWC